MANRRDGAQEQECSPKCADAGLGVDPHCFRHLFGRGAVSLKTSSKLIVADEVDVVEVDRTDERGGMVGLLAMLLLMRKASTPTVSTPARAVPSAVDRLLAVPRNAPTSPANSLGDDVTRMLNNSVSSDPSPRPNDDRLMMTAGVPQPLPMVKASKTRAADTMLKATMAIWRGVNRSYRRTIRTAEVKMAMRIRDDGDGRLQAGSALDDLNVKWDQEVDRRGDCADDEHRDRWRRAPGANPARPARAREICPSPDVGGTRQRKPDPTETPKTIMISAGERPSRLNGASGLAQNTPQLVYIVEAEADQDHTNSGQDGADAVDL